jgi:4-amino-4-deoxy-L-arabinose transferase-like glycosyltransferase
VIAALRRLDERRPLAYGVLAAICGVPRLVALVADRDDVLLPYTLGEKSDDIARTFVDSGTFGFIPGEPTAYTQPLYSFFLIPLYWALDRSWAVVGTPQILVAVGTAWIVYEIGRRVLTSPGAIVAAGLTALHPYVIWHDVHVNREILDGLLAAAIVLLTLLLAERRRLWLAAALGAVLGLAILGNVRLMPLPLVVLGYLAWRWWRPGWSAVGAGALVAVCCTALLVPWVLRNRVQVGCSAITTDSRGLWEANNERTLETLKGGLWIDNVPLPADFPPSAQDAGREYRRHGQIVQVDECKQMRFYRREVVDFWRHHPGEKARLAVQATRMLWNPAVSPSDTREGASGTLNDLRSSVEPLYMLPLFVLAAFGLIRVPTPFAVLAVLLLAYQWFIAMVFVGATRYRVPWDFLIALLAAAALVDLAQRLRRRSSGIPA